MSQDMLANGLAFLTAQLKAIASQTVLYSRGGISAQVSATFGNKLLKLDDGEGGIRMEWTDIDFCIPYADLILDGEQITPKRGDMIEVSTPEGTQLYEAFPYGGESPWRWADPHRSMVRVHAKHVETERNA